MNQSLQRQLTGFETHISDQVPAPLTRRKTWLALESHHARIKDTDLRTLFSDDPQRGERMLLEATGIYFDFSKQRLTAETVLLLMELAHESGLRHRINAMFAGENINVSEQRPALHIALRAPASAVIMVDGVDVVNQVHKVLDKMTDFAVGLRNDLICGYTGKPIRNIINIGIGGSHLGPAMACQALRHYSKRDLNIQFIANVDATQFLETTADLNPEETLFIIVSKTFTTQETMLNAQAAKAWLLAGLKNPQALACHLVGVSAHAGNVAEFGIAPAYSFEVWDWVGGRYSLCSAVGLAVMIAIGPTNFRAMLAGFQQMDEHFRSAPFDCNLPVLMGLLGIWNHNFGAAQTVAVLPYEQYLQGFPAYLQQLSMESNGKSVNNAGEKLDYQTSPIYWGEVGTNGQHSFYQLLHQGTQLIPCDFIGFVEALNPLGKQHELLLANMFAQSEALAFGKTHAEAVQGGTPDWLAPHQTCPGNQPSSTLLLERLSPEALGKLVALYEHSVFTQGVIWDIDSFDQWGVELGKVLAGQIAPELENTQRSSLQLDSSTNNLISLYRRSQQLLETHTL